MYLFNESSVARKIWSLLTAREQHRAVILLFMIFIGMLLETLSVGMVIPAIALLTQGDVFQKYAALRPLFNVLGNPSRTTLITCGMLTLVGVYLVKGVFLAGLYWKQTKLAHDIQVRLSQKLFATYMSQPYTFHLQHNSARLMHNVAGEVTGITGNAISPGIILITESTVLLGMCILMLALEPVGGIVVGGVLGTAAWGFHRLTRTHISHWGVIRQRHEGMRVLHLQQGLGGVKDVKLLGRENEFLQQYRFHNTESGRVTQYQAALQQIPRLWLELLAVSGLAILVISMIVQNRPLDAILPILTLFAAAAFRLMPSVNRILSAVQAIRFGVAGVDLIVSELNLALHESEGVGREIHILNKAVELRNVSYSYQGAMIKSLTGVSLTIHRGESVGFIGASGAGKSTLVDIFLGLLSPDTGTVLLDGRDVKADMRNWQNQIGYVPQAIFLTDDTLRRNIAFGIAEEKIDNAAIRRAIQAAQLEGFVMGLPEGTETVVGERGVRLSGGQRQRIGIARALYHDPEVLVLDEATSSLDTATERGVMDAVKALQGKKTIIIVAHRLSTVEHCDRLYRLDAGHIVEQGSPETMIFQEKNK
jgi:ABC-type multidrug transport system fused ATPase/permease subunit